MDDTPTDPDFEGWLDRGILQATGHSVVVIHPRMDVPWMAPTIARCRTNGITYTGRGESAAEAIKALRMAIEDSGD